MLPTKVSEMANEGTSNTPSNGIPVLVVSNTISESHGEKPKKFNGVMGTTILFYLTTFFKEDALALEKNKTDKQVVVAIDVWKHANFLCRNYILNSLDNTLYNVYVPNRLLGNYGNP